MSTSENGRPDREHGKTTAKGLRIRILLQPLLKAGFTYAAARTLQDELGPILHNVYRRAKGLGELAAPHGCSPDIGSDTVRQAIHQVLGKIERPRSVWWTISQIGEYIAMAVAGAGANALPDPLAYTAFGAALFIGSVLAVARLCAERR